ncbi:MAG: SHOCT domain-containing protein [Armatimonadota bacterium]
MNLSDEISRLQEMHASGVLTDEEFARAKAVVLEDGPDTSGPLAQIGLENELARIDREWDQEREAYLVTGRYGARHLPSEGSGLAGIFLGGGFALVWTVLAFSMGAPVVFALFGIVGVIAAVGMGIAEMEKAERYRETERRWRKRREALLSRARERQQPL